MLGRDFFQLSQALQDAHSFDEVADLLSLRLPRLIGGDSCLIRESAAEGRILAVYGDTPLAHSTRAKLDDLNALYVSHPLFKHIVAKDPGELGLASIDHIPPEKYREIAFNRLLHDGRSVDEALFGKLVSHGNRRHTLLIVFRERAGFTCLHREIFDAILFTARAVVERISSESVERAVRKFLITTTAASPIALFIMQPDGRVFPVSHEAIRLSETWWDMDDPYRQLDKEQFDALRQRVESAWKTPATAGFLEISLDLGGGEMPCHALPKHNGEIILIMPVSGIMPSGEQAIKALLTRRQVEIMDWIAEGKTSAETAIILNISPRTVEKHLEAIFQRLGVENRIAAVRSFLDLKSGLSGGARG